MPLCHNCRTNEAKPLENGEPGVLCLACILGDVEGPRRPVSSLRARFEQRLGMALYDDREFREDMADVQYERDYVERPDRPTRDATKEAA